MNHGRLYHKENQKHEIFKEQFGWQSQVYVLEGHPSASCLPRLRAGLKPKGVLVWKEEREEGQILGMSHRAHLVALPEETFLGSGTGLHLSFFQGYFTQGMRV